QWASAKQVRLTRPFERRPASHRPDFTEVSADGFVHRGGLQMKVEYRTNLARNPYRQAMILAVALACLMLVSADFCTRAGAQMSSTPVPNSQQPNQSRDRAPIGHRQPRSQDLPPGVLRDEGGNGGTVGTTSEERALDRKLE